VGSGTGAVLASAIGCSAKVVPLLAKQWIVDFNDVLWLVMIAQGRWDVFWVISADFGPI